MKSLMALVLAAALSPAAFACHDEYDYLCGHPLMASTIGTTGVIIAPTIATEFATWMSAGGIYKENFIRSAAVEAAQYEVDGQIGPNLQFLIDNNAEMPLETVIDGVLEAAERL